VLLFERHFAASLGRFRISATTSTNQPTATALPVELETLLTRDPKLWTEDERTRVTAYFLKVAPDLADARKEIDALRKSLPAFATTMVLQERPADNPRPTFRHHRGEYLRPREAVTPGVPAMFLTHDAQSASAATDRGDRSGRKPAAGDEPADRLALARWLVSDQNPLVGRVTVNRAWQAFFGHGLVRSDGDFGTQSDPPTHPELLDWLACEFVAPATAPTSSGEAAGMDWSLKRLHRFIVTSATYRQSSRASAEQWRRDPENRLLARGPRFRVDAEIVRDLLLASSGLLAPKVGGPSVYPPQPESVTALAYGNETWKPSEGEDRYRRSLYTFSKRTAPFAAYTVFDGPTGENCIARRERSNTPLQALTLLNDAMFLELAQSLAKAAVESHPDSTVAVDRAAADQLANARATLLFRRLLTRAPSEDERTAIVAFQKSQQTRLEAGDLHPTKIGGAETTTAEFASWVMVARAIMNLDEATTKQ
jgi:hypothetical protein